jgi:prophage maintenance system killer protein
MAAYVFLAVNGWDLRAPEADAVQAVLDLTTKRIDEAAFGEWLRRNCLAIPKPPKRRVKNSRSPRKRRETR